MNTIKVVYDFASPDGGRRSYAVELDYTTLSYVPARSTPPAWARLENHQGRHDRRSEVT